MAALARASRISTWIPMVIIFKVEEIKCLHLRREPSSVVSHVTTSKAQRGMKSIDEKLNWGLLKRQHL